MSLGGQDGEEHNAELEEWGAAGLQVDRDERTGGLGDEADQGQVRTQRAATQQGAQQAHLPGHGQVLQTQKQEGLHPLSPVAPSRPLRSLLPGHSSQSHSARPSLLLHPQPSQPSTLSPTLLLPNTHRTQRPHEPEPPQLSASLIATRCPHLWWSNSLHNQPIRQ